MLVAAITRLLTVLLFLGTVGLTTVATAVAAASDDAYLATLEANGIPIYKEDYVIALGHEVCMTSRQYPSMRVVELAMG